MKQFDVLIVGSGCWTQPCLTIAEFTEHRVAVKSGCSLWLNVMGSRGMVAVLHERDTVASHVDDTLQAGAGLCHEDAVRFTVEQSAAVVDWLVAQGVDFDLRNDQPDDEFREFHLTMEGGHQSAESSTLRIRREAPSQMP